MQPFRSLDPGRLLSGTRLSARLLAVRRELAAVLARDLGCPVSHLALLDVLPVLWASALSRSLTDSGAALGIHGDILLVPGRHSVSKVPSLTGMRVLMRPVSRRKTTEYLSPDTVPTELVARKIAWRAFACGGRRKNSLGVLFVPEKALSRLTELLFAVVAPMTPEEIWGTAAEDSQDGTGKSGVYALPSGATPMCLWNRPLPPAVVSEPVSFPGPVLSLVPYSGLPPEQARPFFWSPFFHLDEPPPPWISVLASPVPPMPPALGI